MNYFKLHSTCIITQGYNRSLLLDIQKNKMELLPNELSLVINDLMSKKSIDDVVEKYGSENKTTIIEYINYLYNNEYGFFLEYEEFKFFPDLPSDFLLPRKIYNSVIELTDYNLTYINRIISQLECLGCDKISLVFFKSIPEDTIKWVLDHFNDSIFSSIDLVIKYTSSIAKRSFINSISVNYHRLTSIILHNCHEDLFLKPSSEQPCEVIYTTKTINSFKFCGNISNKYFDINKDKYFEAKKYNSCLYKKLSIDANGNIKSCPSMSQSFGNIKDTTLKEAFNRPGFKKYWSITKDQIDTCKDCEFRYACTDCRAYIEDPENENSKPLKCGYNPYTNEWEEWSTNPLKQKAIKYYGMQELINNND